MVFYLTMKASSILKASVRLYSLSRAQSNDLFGGFEFIFHSSAEKMLLLKIKKAFAYQTETGVIWGLDDFTVDSDLSVKFHFHQQPAS